MIPMALGAIGAWLFPPLRDDAASLTIIWAALILSFVGGVRRGFGFGQPKASTRIEILTMILYVSIAGLALICAWAGLNGWAAALLAAGFAFVAKLDANAALQGHAPAHFGQLRPPQMAIAVISLVALFLRLATL
ncbi:DUF3429 family protein [Novosphingobium terrae]|uniref:DUF3429 family protein n=1 Tax=Novosphingobium terrae TaxID=2726189 RepID=UPI001F12EA19|nr:DUF3429 family protein [Novosphingobium terrae]